MPEPTPEEIAAARKWNDELAEGLRRGLTDEEKAEVAWMWKA